MNRYRAALIGTVCGIALTIVGGLAEEGNAATRRFTLVLSCWHVRHHRIECVTDRPRKRAVTRVGAPYGPVSSPTGATAPAPTAPAQPVSKVFSSAPGGEPGEPTLAEWRQELEAAGFSPAEIAGLEGGL
jgi:hypothetical protein